MKKMKSLLLALAVAAIGSQSFGQVQRIVPPTDLQKTHDKTVGEKGLRSAYLTLWYNIKQVKDAEWFYDEVNVPSGESPSASYYSAIGGTGFYCGIQVNSPTERRVIFSVWDNKNGNNNPNLTADTDRVELIKAGDGVVSGRFGNEGSGMHTHWVYNWQDDSTYKFLVHVVPDFAHNKTIYSMFFFVDGKWKMMAKISRPKHAEYINNPYSFLEDFTAKDDAHRRAGYFNNQWIRRANGEWMQVLGATFNLPFGDQNRSAKDYGCQLSPNNGYLLVSGGGYTGYFTPDKTKVIRSASKGIPVLNLPE